MRCTGGRDLVERGGRFWRSVGRAVQLVGMFLRAGTELAVRRPRTREARAEWLHQFCARAMRGLGVEVSVQGSFPAGGVVIANHLSYVDIVVFAALHPCVFVSKAEIEHWPVLGWMTTMAGTVYVERGRGGSAAKAIRGMEAATAAGLPVVFFPEGTTSNGSGLLKFHSGLIGQALGCGQTVTAAYVRYGLSENNGPEVSIADDVCFWGETPMLPHIFRFLGLRGVNAQVRFAEAPIVFSAAATNRKVAAREAQAAVSALCASTGDGGGCRAEEEASRAEMV